MGDQVWLTVGQVERLRPHVPKARGKARSDDRMVLSGIIHLRRNGFALSAPATTGLPAR
jgi:transposase